MGVGVGIGRVVSAAVLLAGLAGSCVAQGSIAVNVSAPLLPVSFGQWKLGGSAAAGGFSLSALSQQALEECAPQRSQVASYQRGGAQLQVEAVQFGDRTGAYSAFTLAERPGWSAGHGVGSAESVGPGQVLFTQGTTVVLVSGTTDAASLKPLAALLPKASGNAGIAPLLPALAPTKGLVAGSVRYALGPATYAAQGGVLPAQSLGWEKSAEAVTAHYTDSHGAETLTLLLYPTPEIAGTYTRAIQGAMGRMGPQFAQAKVRREGELVLLATGSWDGELAQHMIENIHLRQVLSIDKDVQPVFHVEVQKTASLLSSIAVLSGVLMLAAVTLGLFLGGGRALYRVVRGKPAAAEIEFLSLHLEPQSKPAVFDAPPPEERGGSV